MEAFAVMVALWSGIGQVVDVNLPMLGLVARLSSTTGYALVEGGTMGLAGPRDGTSPYWKLVGYSTRCATLDLRSDEGRATLLRLVDEAHDATYLASHPNSRHRQPVQAARDLAFPGASGCR